MWTWLTRIAGCVDDPDLEYPYRLIIHQATPRGMTKQFFTRGADPDTTDLYSVYYMS